MLDSMTRMIRAKGVLNVFGFLKYIRTQRNFLVQTEEQYIFLHDALLEAIESGETDIHRTFLRRYLHNLQTTEQDIYPWYNLDRQFRVSRTSIPGKTSNSIHGEFGIFSPLKARNEDAYRPGHDGSSLHNTQ